jgi:Na+/phosphate symporter
MSLVGIAVVSGFAGWLAALILKSPKRLSYAAAKHAFSAASEVVSAAQAELARVLKMAQQQVIDIQTDYTKSYAQAESEKLSALYKTRSLRSALREFFNNLTREDLEPSAATANSAQFNRALQLQTIGALFRELDNLEADAAKSKNGAVTAEVRA